MAFMVLPKGCIMQFNGNGLTEHNRSTVDVDIDRIENARRMINGSMRKYVVADKYKWSVSWDEVPSDDAATVDGKWGGKSIESFYKTNPGVFTLTIQNAAGSPEVYNAFISSFNKTLLKRGGSTDLWKISLTIEEA
jgi:hypothetical protein